MKQLAAIACMLLACLGSNYAAEAPPPEEQQIAAALKELQAQQALIAENHAKIEAKLVVVAEAIRVARIYSSRSGH